LAHRKPAFSAMSPTAAGHVSLRFPGSVHLLDEYDGLFGNQERGGPPGPGASCPSVHPIQSKEKVSTVYSRSRWL
jgi:hypothetical protein